MGMRLGLYCIETEFLRCRDQDHKNRDHEKSLFSKVYFSHGIVGAFYYTLVYLTSSYGLFSDSPETARPTSQVLHQITT